MELYAGGADRKVYLEVPVEPIAATMTVALERNRVPIHEFATVLFEDDGRYSVSVPFAYTQNEGEYEVHWEFQYSDDGGTYTYLNHTPVSIVRPYIPLTEVASIIEASGESAPRIEVAVRNLINSFCGQSFGYGRKTLKVAGRGSSSLRLPEKLHKVYSIQREGFDRRLYDVADVLGNSFLGQGLFRVTGDGWYLATSGAYVGGGGIKADYHGQLTVTGPIYDPYKHYTSVFSPASVLMIDGEWGWKEVPGPVQEAARLLANDFACQDSIYRDRYVEAITSADWRLQFNSGAYTKTGNARADQLLSNYVLPRGWLVV